MNAGARRVRPAAIGGRFVEHEGSARGRGQRRRGQPYAGDVRPPRRGLSRGDVSCRLARSAGRRDRSRRASRGGSRLAPAYRGRRGIHRRGLCSQSNRSLLLLQDQSLWVNRAPQQRTDSSGANLDDLREYRPGLEAAKHHSVRHPYLEAGVDKRAVRSLARELGLGALSELPAAPCLSSRVETGIAIRAEVLRAIHAVERSIAKDFPAGIVRCRVRAKGIVIELDPETLAAISGARKDEARVEAGRIFAGIAPSADLSFAPYRNGGAFVHSRA